MRDLIKLARVQLITLVPFIFFKAVRPYVLKNDYPEFANIFVLSFPNFCEGIIGVMTVTMISLVIHHKLGSSKISISENYIYIIATLLSAVYVLLQEFRIHNLGGNNVFDPYDVVFSIIGLIIGYILLIKIKPRFRNTE
ncbi:hypothetical protein U6A24_09730 [Aquimarina gracilis]|uniref:VanZ like protein n=1 Tax=Aquimarina gracilis TaxID=874422 RepID=A0ABU5ZV67_9FLAO|nr:hypothetical protein [Aquimarina gracilis]MEB3345741.1 hypothetical protein [Aquimarina gracilis]